MMTLRPSAERGGGDHGWLQSKHSFSFADYYDPAHMAFRSLRVINEDYVAPSNGFPRHPHRDMEIVTYVISGALEHQDSMGNREIIHAGEMQVMHAGTGITHSEYNPSATETVHLLQIWLLPERGGLTPGYLQKSFGDARRDRLCLVAARGGREGALPIHQDVALYACILSPGATLALPLAAGRHAWVQVVAGEIAVNGTVLHAGDGAALSQEPQVALGSTTGGELLVFDLA